MALFPDPSPRHHLRGPACSRPQVRDTFRLLLKGTFPAHELHRLGNVNRVVSFIAQTLPLQMASAAFIHRFTTSGAQALGAGGSQTTQAKWAQGCPWTSGAGPTIPEGDCFQFFPRGQPGGAVAGVTRRPWTAQGPASSHTSASPRFFASVSRLVAHPLTGVLSPSYTPASPGELRKRNKAGPNMTN